MKEQSVKKKKMLYEGKTKIVYETDNEDLLIHEFTDDAVDGAKSKELLIRDEDVQVLHGFTSVAAANAYLTSKLFNDDIVAALKPLLQAEPDVAVYAIA